MLYNSTAFYVMLTMIMSHSSVGIVP